MTIFAILLAFGLCHLVRELGRCRQYQWLGKWVDFSNETFGKLPAWHEAVGFLLILLVPIAGLLLLNNIADNLLGSTGQFLLALAVLVYCFGPTDLDTDVASVVQASDDEERRENLEALLGGPAPEEEDACRQAAVESVFSEALKRWFAVIFWFALLGIVGAFLYRMVDRLLGCGHNISDDQRGLFIRTKQVMDWPVAQLMTLALAIATDFDSVFRAWKKYHDEQGHGLFEGNNGFLLASASTIVFSGHAARDGYADQLDGPMIGLQQAMDLVWRVLGVWLTALALLLLVGVIA